MSNLQKLSSLSQEQFEKLFSQEGMVKVESLDSYDPEEKFNAVVSILQKLIIMGSSQTEVRDQAIKILSEANVKPHDTYGEIEAILKWVQFNIRYTQDAFALESFNTCHKTLISKCGDCDCEAILLCCLLRSVGINSGIVLTNTSGEEVDHAMSVVTLNKDAVSTWGMKDEDGHIQAIQEPMLEFIPKNLRIPLKSLKGSTPEKTIWHLLEATEHKDIDFCPSKSTFFIIITPEIIEKIELPNTNKGEI